MLKECDLAKEVYAPSLAKSAATSFRLNIFLVLWLVGYDFNIPASAHFCTVILSVPRSQATLSISNVLIFRLPGNISLDKVSIGFIELLNFPINSIYLSTSGLASVFVDIEVNSYTMFALNNYTGHSFLQNF